MHVASGLVFAVLLASASCAAAPRATPAPPVPPVPPAAAPAAAQAPRAVERPLDPQMVADYVLAQSPMVRGCYDHEVEKKHDVSGKILIGWTIDETGSPRGIVVQLNTMQDSSVADCLQVLIRDWHFAKPPAGPVKVNFPFTFQAVAGAKPPKEEPTGPKTSI